MTGLPLASAPQARPTGLHERVSMQVSATPLANFGGRAHSVGGS